MDYSYNHDFRVSADFDPYRKESQQTRSNIFSEKFAHRRLKKILRDKTEDQHYENGYKFHNETSPKMTKSTSLPHIKSVQRKNTNPSYSYFKNFVQLPKNSFEQETEKQNISKIIKSSQDSKQNNTNLENHEISDILNNTEHHEQIKLRGTSVGYINSQIRHHSNIDRKKDRNIHKSMYLKNDSQMADKYLKQINFPNNVAVFSCKNDNRNGSLNPIQLSLLSCFADNRRKNFFNEIEEFNNSAKTKPAIIIKYDVNGNEEVVTKMYLESKEHNQNTLLYQKIKEREDYKFQQLYKQKLKRMNFISNKLTIGDKITSDGNLVNYGKDKMKEAYMGNRLDQGCVRENKVIHDKYLMKKKKYHNQKFNILGIF